MLSDLAQELQDGFAHPAPMSARPGTTETRDELQKPTRTQGSLTSSTPMVRRFLDSSFQVTILNVSVVRPGAIHSRPIGIFSRFLLH